MSTISLRLPESLHAQVRALAGREGVSINQLITLALAEKVSALLTEDYLADRATRGNRDRYDAVMAKVRAVPPDPADALPDTSAA